MHTFVINLTDVKVVHDFTNNKICNVLLNSIQSDSQIQHVLFELLLMFKESGFGFAISVAAAVEGGGDILQRQPLSMIANYKCCFRSNNI